MTEEKMREALRCLRNAAQEVMDGLHRRIDEAPKHAVPVFSGIALLHGAIAQADTALSQEGPVASASETEENAEIMAAEAALLAELVEGFLACPEIADCAPEDKDPDTHELERRARAILRGDAQGLVAGADGKGGKP